MRTALLSLCIMCAGGCATEPQDDVVGLVARAWSISDSYVTVSKETAVAQLRLAQLVELTPVYTQQVAVTDRQATLTVEIANIMIALEEDPVELSLEPSRMDLGSVELVARSQPTSHRVPVVDADVPGLTSHAARSCDGSLALQIHYDYRVRQVASGNGWDALLDQSGPVEQDRSAFEVPVLCN